MVVQSLSKLINESAIAKVTDVYYNLQSCRKGLTKHLPDILLLDIEIPNSDDGDDGDGVAFCSEVTEIYPTLKVIMLTAYREFNIAKHAMANGADGYILKNADPEEMFTGIEKVYRGEKFLCEKIRLLLQDKRETDTIWLTDIEKRILQLCAEGYTRKQIANIINRNHETIKSHMKNIRVKLAAKNTTQAVKTGYIMKLI
jgi:DNA-binding NarL/FixJ family response regulator